jgi:hypothetical protein
MIRITIDEALWSKLYELGQEVELCDSSGRVVGQFVPKFDPSEWEPATPEASEEELQRREQSTEWFTTEEVLAHLEKLKCSESDGNGKP